MASLPRLTRLDSQNTPKLTLPRGDQELLVAFRRADPAFGQPQHRPALRGQPGADARADLLVQGGIAHHPALADARLADLELRLDQGDEHGPRLGNCECRWQHRLEADEARIAHD